MWYQDERDGKNDRSKGKAKEVVGGVTDKDDLKVEGLHDGAVGNVEETEGLGMPQSGHAVEKIKNAAARS